MRRLVRIVLLTVCAAVLMTGGVSYWGYRAFVAPGPLDGKRVVLVQKGSGLKRIAATLEEAGVIASSVVFVWGARLSGGARAIKAGEYAFEGRPSPREVLALLVEGKTVLHRLTIPEGLTSREVVALIESAPVMDGQVGLPPAEGSVLPETYSYEYGDTRASLLQQMTRAMRETVERLWAARAADLPLDDPAQAVVLASIVEKETAVPAERPRIAAVFENRLRRGMRLQSDPTVVYGLNGGAGPLGRPLTRSDLETDHPYNTYRIDGLPPGPICNPGRDSLAAVLNPIKTDELYFVADGTGGHVFSRTLEEHNRNVARWRRIERDMKAK